MFVVAPVVVFVVIVVLAGLVRAGGARGRIVRPVEQPVCGGCRHSVRGLTAPICPECGADLDGPGVVDARDVRSPRRLVAARAVSWLLLAVVGWWMLAGVAFSVWPRPVFERAEFRLRSPAGSGGPRIEVEIARLRRGAAGPDGGAPAGSGRVVVCDPAAPGSPRLVLTEAEVRALEPKALADRVGDAMTAFPADRPPELDRAVAEAMDFLADPERSIRAETLHAAGDALDARLVAALGSAPDARRVFVRGRSGGFGRESPGPAGPMLAAAVLPLAGLIAGGVAIVRLVRRMRPEAWTTMPAALRAPG